MSRVVVYHGTYGCESGCCGHIITVDDTDIEFDHGHPATSETHRAYAERIIREELGDEHVKDLDWDNSFISED